MFLDNAYEPEAIGSSCSVNPMTQRYTDTTIADLLEKAGVTWAWYSEGYATMAQAVKAGSCPPNPPQDCPLGSAIYPCLYDPSDNPFAYYQDLVDDPAHFKDYAMFATDLVGGTLPAVSYIKPIGYKTEHPGYGDTVSAGVAFVSAASEGDPGVALRREHPRAHHLGRGRRVLRSHRASSGEPGRPPALWDADPPHCRGPARPKRDRFARRDGAFEHREVHRA